ncbi:hypothetical protein MNEG_9996 [Monoraphidium neglectum]|jgi:hypothetical protein|uniref:Uncharacterized protein n=1 Tax=Monoraphidium neglectum TaxID=145388 RepID=A0A0D2MU54_9CHLO|nr:hypothetical protein MNEG_9996 [Monoraphidium neglectum]KIY97965.1 hypothetical protein MNEG_9996 [Monoraphidium neglectum]|eukprot:XP_013896985.1 hypothetical protein MNEG_9996 [Monoraphidium neglectum]
MGHSLSREVFAGESGLQARGRGGGRWPDARQTPQKSKKQRLGMVGGGAGGFNSYNEQQHAWTISHGGASSSQPKAGASGHVASPTGGDARSGGGAGNDNVAHG